MKNKQNIKTRVDLYVEYILGDLHREIFHSGNLPQDQKVIYIVSTCLVSPYIGLKQQLKEWCQVEEGDLSNVIEKRSKDAMRYEQEILNKIKCYKDVDMVKDWIESSSTTKTVGIACDEEELKALLLEMCLQQQFIISKVGRYGLTDYELSFYDEIVDDTVILHCSLV